MNCHTCGITLVGHAYTLLGVGAVWYRCPEGHLSTVVPDGQGPQVPAVIARGWVAAVWCWVRIRWDRRATW